MTPERLAEIEHQFHAGMYGSLKVEECLLDLIAALREAWRDLEEMRLLMEEWKDCANGLCKQHPR